MDRKQQVLRSFINAFLKEQGRMPTQREIDNALQRLFTFTTKPLVPKDGAISNPDYLKQTLNGLLTDTRDIIELLRQYNDDYDELARAFRKENEELNTEAATVLDHLRSVSEIEKATGLIYTSLPSMANASLNVVSSEESITLKNDMLPIEGWTVVASAVSSTGLISRQRITDPTKLEDGQSLFANIESSGADWTGVELLFTFNLSEEDDDLPVIRKLSMYSTPSQVTMASENLDEGTWDWGQPFSSDGSLSYFVDYSTTGIRLKLWTPGPTFDLALHKLDWLTGEFNPHGVMYSMPIPLSKHGDLERAHTLTGNYIVDIRSFEPESTEVTLSYALLTAQDMQDYLYNWGSYEGTVASYNIGGGGLHKLNWIPFPAGQSRTTVPVGYSNLLQNDTNTPNEDEITTHGIPEKSIDISITSSVATWVLTLDTENRRTWQTYLDVFEGDARVTAIPEYANNLVIRRVSGSGPAVYSGAGSHSLTPGIYRVLYSVDDVASDTWPLEATPNDTQVLSIDTTEFITMKAFPMPFARELSNNALTSDGVYTHTGTASWLGRSGLLYDIEYRLPDSALIADLPRAICIKAEMTTTNPGRTPIVRQVRLMTTAEMYNRTDPVA